jgi:oxygen-independent coproporphyrinogen-3 oxidase
LEEYLLCKNYLEEKWFNRYELSNFAKKWFDCKHNKAYWNHENMLALWLWAHWFLDWVRYAYSNKFNDYYSWKLDYEEILSKDDLFLEKIMFGLRTAWLEPEIYKKLNQEKINYFIKQNLLDFRQDKLVLLDNWVVLIDYIIKEII